jgi:hypothetical protein
MIIYVKTLFGNTLILEVEETDGIASVKTKIVEQMYIFKSDLKLLADNIKLICAGTELLDERTLEDYNIQKESGLICILNKTKSKIED